MVEVPRGVVVDDPDGELPLEPVVVLVAWLVETRPGIVVVVEAMCLAPFPTPDASEPWPLVASANPSAASAITTTLTPTTTMGHLDALYTRGLLFT